MAVIFTYFLFTSPACEMSQRPNRPWWSSRMLFILQAPNNMGRLMVFQSRGMQFWSNYKVTSNTGSKTQCTTPPRWVTGGRFSSGMWLILPTLSFLRIVEGLQAQTQSIADSNTRGLLQQDGWRPYNGTTSGEAERKVLFHCYNQSSYEISESRRGSENQYSSRYPLVNCFLITELQNRGLPSRKRCIGAVHALSHQKVSHKGYRRNLTDIQLWNTV